MEDKFKYELIIAKKKIIEIKATNITNGLVFNIGIGTYPIQFLGGTITGSNWRRIANGSLFIIYKHTNKLEIKKVDEIIKNIHSTTAEIDSEVNKILQVINYLKEQKEIPDEYKIYKYETSRATYQDLNVNDLLSPDISKFNAIGGQQEKLYIDYKMEFEASLMHRVATDYEKRSGYEVTVIGGAVMDTICKLVPHEINLYISKPYDYSNEGSRTYIDGGYNKTIEKLAGKELFTFEDDYTYYNNFETNTVSKGFLKTEALTINIFIGQESANDFVDAVSPMNIGLLTYTVKEGLYVPNVDIEKCIENRTISYHSKQFEMYLFDELSKYYLDPTEERLKEIYDAVVRYGFKLNPIKVRLQDTLKDIPFGELKFVDLGDSTKEMEPILALEVPEYKKTVLEAMSFLLIDLGYEFYELKKMRLVLFDHHHGFNVTTSFGNQIRVASTYDGSIIQGASIEEVRNAIRV
ncbi:MULTISPECIES: hypothetical protein [Bacillus]|uniref:hypothetical protein n=1 Tax=Bacillus TaxID=1386 RepID=UPI000993AB16|nr:hypothetical protein [Bacillus cereus]OOQ95589.1 hypothetical protein BW898_10530 [Bacillus cereus]